MLIYDPFFSGQFVNVLHHIFLDHPVHMDDIWIIALDSIAVTWKKQEYSMIQETTKNYAKGRNYGRFFMTSLKIRHAERRDYIS